MTRGLQTSVAVILTFAAHAPASGQRATPVQRPGWLPPITQWADDMTAAQRTAAMTVLREFERIILEIPELANPVGFEIAPAFAGGYRLLGPDDAPMPNSLLRYNYGLAFYAPTKAIAGEAAACLGFVVNENPPREQHRGEGGIRIWEEGDRGKPVPHSTHVLGELWDVPGEPSFLDVFFISAGELPWRQVTREELIHTLLYEFEPGAAELQTALQKTPYQEWMAGAEERRRIREQTLRDAAIYRTPAEIEELRKTLEATERQVTEQLRKDEESHRERNAEARSSLGGIGDSLRATLGRMSPAERSMPAFVTAANVLPEAPRAMGYAFTSDTLPPARRLLTPNWAFYRPRRSQVEVRSIRFSIGISLTCLKPEIQHALLETFRKIDWAAIHRLLDQPRTGGDTEEGAR